MVTAPARIAVIGAGWRAGYALRVAHARPDLVQITGVYARSPTSAARIRARWDVPTSTTLSEVLRAGSPEAAFVCVPREAVAGITDQIGDTVPMLLETPPGPDRDSLFRIYDQLGDRHVQVSEQYQFQPQHAARIAVVRSGLLGDVGSASVSVAHDYHAVSMLRLLLGIGFENVTIAAWKERDQVRSVRTRDSWRDEPVLTEQEVVHGRFHWPRRTGHYTFGSEQYVSPLRTRHLWVRGVDGELIDDDVSHYVAPGRVATGVLTRDETGRDGDLEGAHLRQVWLGPELLADNRFAPARLSDDEIALGECLVRTVEHVRGGPAFYPLADACEDAYLALLLHEAAQVGSSMQAEARPWQSATSIAQRSGNFPSSRMR